MRVLRSVAIIRVNPNFPSYLLSFIYPILLCLSLVHQNKVTKEIKQVITRPQLKHQSHWLLAGFYINRSDNSQTTSHHGICGNSCHGSGVISAPAHNKSANAVAIISYGYIQLF